MQTSQRSVLSWGIGQELPWRTGFLISYGGLAPSRVVITFDKLKLNWRREDCLSSLRHWIMGMLASQKNTSSGGEFL
jgi:hypothetical protein